MLSKKHCATTAYKALSNSTGHNKNKFHWSFFSAVSFTLTACMDVILITIYCTRIARKRCSFNERIMYCKASNLNKYMAVPVCVCVWGGKEREGERRWQWGDRSACERKQGSSSEQHHSATAITVLLNMCAVPTCSWRACLHVQYPKDPLQAPFLFLVLNISK